MVGWIDVAKKNQVGEQDPPMHVKTLEQTPPIHALTGGA
jgi:hypothetical protein